MSKKLKNGQTDEHGPLRRVGRKLDKQTNMVPEAGLVENVTHGQTNGQIEYSELRKFCFLR